MKPITLDTKHFDYNNIQESLVAVPVSVLKDYFKMKDKIEKLVSVNSKNLIRKSLTKKSTIKKSPTWILTREDILESGRQAMEEYKKGTLITL